MIPRFDGCFFSPRLLLASDTSPPDTRPFPHRSRRTERNRSAETTSFACAAGSSYSSSVVCESAFCPSPCAPCLNLPSPDAALFSSRSRGRHPENKKQIKADTEAEEFFIRQFIWWREFVPGSVADCFPESLTACRSLWTRPAVATCICLCADCWLCPIKRGRRSGPPAEKPAAGAPPPSAPPDPDSSLSHRRRPRT